MRHALLLVGSLTASLLYSETLTIEGVWNGGGQEVYTDGNQHYCFKPDDGSSVTLDLTNPTRRFKSCIYLTYGDVKASECKNDPEITINNLNNNIYKVVLAPVEPATNENYTLDVTFDGEFGRCSDYYQSGFLGMSLEAVNFILALSGMLTAIGLWASIGYVILTLGNF